MTSTTPSTVNYTVSPNFNSNARFISISTGDSLHNIAQPGTASAQVFTDVPATNPFFVAILGLQQKGITLGCGNGEYCPNEVVTRGQMAAFIMRTIAGGDNFAFPAAQRFTDVPSTHPFFKHVQSLALLGITLGCGVDIYCPDDPVTRGQMAAFLMRALAGNRFRASTVQVFNDVPPAHEFFRYVQAMSQRGITQGVSVTPPLYAPESPVTREQMAAFITRAFSTR